MSTSIVCQLIDFISAALRLLYQLYLANPQLTARAWTLFQPRALHMLRVLRLPPYLKAGSSSNSSNWFGRWRQSTWGQKRGRERETKSFQVISQARQVRPVYNQTNLELALRDQNKQPDEGSQINLSHQMENPKSKSLSKEALETFICGLLISRSTVLKKELWF